MRKRPWLSLFTDCAAPVPTFRISTTASGRTAPDVSVTVPKIVAVVPWPNKVLASHRHAITENRNADRRIAGSLPLQNLIIRSLHTGEIRSVIEAAAAAVERLPDRFGRDAPSQNWRSCPVSVELHNPAAGPPPWSRRIPRAWTSSRIPPERAARPGARSYPSKRCQTILGWRYGSVNT